MNKKYHLKKVYPEDDDANTHISEDLVDKNVKLIITKEVYDRFEKGVKTNLEFENNITSQMEKEIEVIDDYLDFIFEHKSKELSIARHIESREVIYDEKEMTPPDFYEPAHLSGLEILDEDNGKEKESEEYKWSGENSFQPYDIREIQWETWTITYAGKNWYDEFEIEITPFLIRVQTEDSKNDKSKNETLKIFTPVIYDKWNSKLEEIFLNEKKNKVSRIISDSYKILGIDRQAKIRKILGDDNDNGDE